jgi:hypothetical protein
LGAIESQGPDLLQLKLIVRASTRLCEPFEIGADAALDQL